METDIAAMVTVAVNIIRTRSFNGIPLLDLDTLDPTESTFEQASGETPN